VYQPRFLRAVEAVSVLLFFLQALRAVFSVLFGIIYDQVFAGTPDAWLVISVLLVALAFSAPVLAPSGWPRAWLAALAAVASMGRIALTINDATVRFWGSLAVLAAGGLYLAGLLVARRPLALTALAGALALDQALRALGQTYDLSLRPWWLPVQVAWAVVVLAVSAALLQRRVTGGQNPCRLGVRAGLGLGALFFIETSLLALPNAAARWSQAPYSLMAAFLLGITLLALLPRVRREVNRAVCDWPALRGFVALLIPATLMLGYFVQGAVGATALLAGQVVVLVGFTLLFDGRATRERPVGPMLALGMGILLVLNFLNAFAFTYPYAVPVMRGLGWAVYLAAGLIAAVGVISQNPMVVSWDELATRAEVVGLVGAGLMIVTLFAVWPQPAIPLTETGPLRVATYNIHYGYDAEWHVTLDEIARTIEDSGAQVIALQEVDTGRLTSYGADDAYYLASRLQMNAAYLPTVEHLTGIAVLYRGRPAEVRQLLLTSLQEQTGIVEVSLHPGTEELQVFGIWMGLSNEDTGRQIREALEFIGDTSPAAFGGDFNAEPETDVALAVKSAGFVDPFVALGINPPPLTDPAVDPSARIDYVWLRGVEPVDAWVANSLASDHRMVVVEIDLGP
jgi:endonuclease/exonuclease/phosphatase family metal-dependent hydrolase